jgi:hypothetical protein
MLSQKQVIVQFSNQYLTPLRFQELEIGKTYYMHNHNNNYYGKCTHKTKSQISFDLLYQVNIETKLLSDIDPRTGKESLYAEEYILVDPIEINQKNYFLKGNKEDYDFIRGLTYIEIS